MKRWLWAFTALVGVAACSEDELRLVNPTGSGGSGAGSTTTITPSGDEIKDFCDAVIRPYCEAYFACCTEPDRLAQRGGSVESCIDENDCEARMKDPEDGLVDAVEAGITVLDYDRLAACVARIDGLGAGGSACIEPPMRAHYDCFAAFEGQVEPGEACGAIDADMSWVECKDGYCRDGICVAFLGHGEPCENSEDATEMCNISNWEWCVDDGSGQPTCREYQEIGGACVPAATTGGVGCPVGEDCTPDTTDQLQCRSRECVDDECQPPDTSGMCVGGG